MYSNVIIFASIPTPVVSHAGLQYSRLQGIYLEIVLCMALLMHSSRPLHC